MRNRSITGRHQGSPNANDSQHQPYYAQQQQNAYYPLQLLPIGLFRPIGQ